MLFLRSLMMFVLGTFLGVRPLLADGEAAPQQPSMIENLIPFALIFVVMYFLVIRPQNKKRNEQAELLKALRPGDEVVTLSGLVGRIKSIQDELFMLDLGSTNVRVLKESVQRKYSPAAATATPAASEKK